MIGRVVGRLGAWSVAQCEVGLLPIPDAHGRLVPGDGVELEVRAFGDECHDDDPCIALCVEQGPDGLALLRRPGDGCAPPIPVVLTAPWPSLVAIRAYSPSPEVAEGAENFGNTTTPTSPR